MGQSFCKKRAPDEELTGLKFTSGSNNAGRTTQSPPSKAAEEEAERCRLAGNDAVKKGDYKAAYEAYSQGLESDPDHAMILSNRALCLEKMGRLEEAIKDAKRCAVLRPDFVKGFLRAASLLKDLKRPQEALDVLRNAPKNGEIDQLAAKLRQELETSSTTSSASKKPSQSREAASVEKLKEEGNDLFKKGLFEQAEKVYLKALQGCKDPVGELALAIHNNLAGCYHQLSDYKSVVREASFVLQQQPDNLKALIRRMLALEPLEKYEDALNDARRVIRLAPANEPANKLQHRLSKLVRDMKREQ